MLHPLNDSLINIKNEADFRKLFNEYYPSLYLYAKRIIKNAEVADDITQEVFLDLWNKREMLKIHSIAGFLYTSTRFKCMNHLRAIKKHELKHVDIDENLSVQVEDRLYLIEEEMVREIRKLIRSMPEKRRKVFELHIDGLDQQEIAHELGVSINTVKTHKLKARQFLKEQLKNLLYLLFLLRF